MKPLWEQLKDGDITLEQYYQLFDEKVNVILRGV